MQTTAQFWWVSMSMIPEFGVWNGQKQVCALLGLAKSNTCSKPDLPLNTTLLSFCLAKCKLIQRSCWKNIVCCFKGREEKQMDLYMLPSKRKAILSPYLCKTQTEGPKDTSVPSSFSVVPWASKIFVIPMLEYHERCSIYAYDGGGDDLISHFTD